MGAHVAGSVLLFVFAVVMGVTFTGDIGGLATKMRQRLEERSIFGYLYKRMPSWMFRAFGVWRFVCGIGWLIYVYSLCVACGGSRLPRRVTAPGRRTHAQALHRCHTAPRYYGKDTGHPAESYFLARQVTEAIRETRSASRRECWLPRRGCRPRRWRRDR